MGTAFELRARLFFAGDVLELAVPPHLEKFLELEPLDWNLNQLFQNQVIRRYRSELPKLLSNQNEPQKEERIVRYCFAFAWLEEIYRAGQRVTAYSPLIKQRPRSLKALLEMPKSEWVEDVGQLVDLFQKRCENLMRGSVILDPELEGSRDIGGADPDFIAANELVDIKTVKTLKADRFRRWVYQLIGYVLLDYGNKYEISGLSIYFARHGVRMTWPFPEVLDLLSERSLPSLEVLRQNFREVVVGV